MTSLLVLCVKMHQETGFYLKKVTQRGSTVTLFALNDPLNSIT